VCYRWAESELYFKDALCKIQSSDEQSDITEKWEPLLNNLGHTCRKLKYVDSFNNKQSMQKNTGP